MLYYCGIVWKEFQARNRMHHGFLGYEKRVFPMLVPLHTNFVCEINEKQHETRKKVAEISILQKEPPDGPES